MNNLADFLEHKKILQALSECSLLPAPKIPIYLIKSCLLPLASCLSLSDAARSWGFPP
ncbi:hypothetical protein [Moorena sp. SIO3H5]|uniref:hypothetical protein n=1 Tax=Moorena sp. SIO3H5 TaxID=2607834 RepID=UPI0013B80739|nr:hypothetical protein [Moorena sp. SIO3H5]NEO72510.1 hypothetical protein [Moorena sp. SIO3H5]